VVGGMLWGCCTKEQCHDELRGQSLLSVRVKVNPKLNISARIQVYKTLKGQSNFVLDSLQLSAKGDQDSIVLLESTKYNNENRTLNFFHPGFDYLLIHKQYGISDTLTEYQYQSRKEEKGCNEKSIFLIPAGYCDYYNIHHIENVSFRYNGRLVQGGMIPDTLVLK
jgi:hypothetical protein